MPVSVILPAYRAEAFIGQAIESVLAQTYRDFELLVLDDGSTDATLEVVRRYAERDARVKVKSRPNRGVSATSNELLEWAQHEFVAMMHADDLMLPQRLERQVAFLEANPAVAATSCFVEYIDATGRKIGGFQSEFVHPDVVWARYHEGHVVAIHHPGVMMRRSVVLDAGGYRPGFTVTEDVDLFMRLLEKGHLVLVMPETLLAYRLHGTSASVSQALKMRREKRWVLACSVARRSGRPEPSFAEHLTAEATDPTPVRFRRALRDHAQVHYKAAVFAYARRELLTAAWHVALSTMLRPGFALRQLWRKRPGR